LRRWRGQEGRPAILADLLTVSVVVSAYLHYAPATSLMASRVRSISATWQPISPGGVRSPRVQVYFLTTFTTTVSVPVAPLASVTVKVNVSEMEVLPLGTVGAVNVVFTVAGVFRVTVGVGVWAHR
jgi:hypothetical protein